MWALCALLGMMMALAQAAPSHNTSSWPLELRMPNVQPKIADTYLCHSKKTSDVATYLTGFEPHGDMHTAHHILLYGCKEPGRSTDVWNCGEMQSTDSSYDQGPVCAEGAQILYAWAMDAPKLNLPKGVGFKIGADTGIDYLVLQVHYKDVSKFVAPKNGKDDSGITITETDIPQPKRAGVYLLGTGGSIPAHSTTYMDTACSIDDNLLIHPFAFRVHAHTHGKVVSGYRVRDGKWTELGRMSPQKPQMFYNVTHQADVKQGDILAARCTMVNDDDAEVKIGSTQKDEMCNFYLMYYVDGPEILGEDQCFASGPPHMYWQDMKSVHVENAPGDVSVVPGTDKVLKATEKFMKDTAEKMNAMEEDMKNEFAHLMEEMGDNAWQGEMEEEQLLGDPAASSYFADEEIPLRAQRRYTPFSEEELEQYYNELYGR